MQVTARSDRDLTPEGIVQKVSDASGAKYGGSSTPTPASASSAAPPPVATKPVFMPTRAGGAGGFNPLASRNRAPVSAAATDGDGWGEDAPQVTRSQLEKVAPAYKPTKVNMAELTSQKQEPSRFEPAPRQENNGADVVRGGYQPIGKVDINAIRRQAQSQGTAKDDRPAPVKGSYEPIGKVDIAAIRAKANAAPAASSPPPPPSSADQPDEDAPPKSLAERSAAFANSERLTSLPKPKVANRFGSGAGAFTGTKAPSPAGFESKPLATSAPIGAADKNFAAQGGKTPAQLWAEKKARERGMSGSGDAVPSPASSNAPASPIPTQQSGTWQSGYSGKKWGDVAINRTGASAISAQQTGASNLSAQRTGQEEERAVPTPPAGGVGAIANRFKDTPPMGAGNVGPEDDDESSAPAPPPMDFASKPNAGAARGVPMPGLPQRPAAPPVPEDHPADEHVDLPPPPPQPPRSPSPEPDAYDEPSSPVRIAMPVSRTAEPEPMSPPEEAPLIPAASISRAIEDHADVEPESQVAEDDLARGTAAAVAGAGASTANPGAAIGGKRALIQYDYEKAEDNEIELVEGEYVINIEMVDDDWWMGQNSKGETGLFPSNYVELVDDDDAAAGAHDAPPSPAQYEEEPAHAPAAPSASAGKPTATAQYDYEAAEDNELSFPDGATIHNVVSLVDHHHSRNPSSRKVS